MLTPGRRRLAALTMVLLVPVLGACQYQTDQVYQPSVGVNNRDGTVDVLGAVVVSTSFSSGTFVASLVNKDLEEPDALTNVTGEGVEAQVTAPVQIKPESLVNLADTGAVGVAGDNIRPGKFVRLTLEFQSGQKTEVNVPVVPAESIYATVKPASPPSSSSSPSQSPSP
jgi:hypothetical protein